MNDTRQHPAVTAADFAEHIANLLGDPLPDDWQDQMAAAVRQHDLAATAHIAGEVVLHVFTDIAGTVRQGTPLDHCRGMLVPLGPELMELDQAMRRYAHDMQRGDASAIVRAALDASAGATIAALSMRTIARVRVAEREMMARQGAV